MLDEQQDEAQTMRHSRFVTIDLAHQLTGLTIKAINRKIESGVWRAGHEYVRQADDGRLYIDMKGYERWVAKDRASNYAHHPSASGSNGKGSGAAKPSTSRQRRPTRDGPSSS